MHGICTCKHIDMYTSCVLCFQSGGGGTTSGMEIAFSAWVVSASGVVESLVAASDHQVNWPWEVEIVSKTCV